MSVEGHAEEGCRALSIHQERRCGGSQGGSALADNVPQESLLPILPAASGVAMTVDSVPDIIDAPAQMAVEGTGGPGRKDNWWLRRAWGYASEHVREVCEKIKVLGNSFPGQDFAKQQTSVTVGDALLLEWAVQGKKKTIAQAVMHQLISGEVGSQPMWDPLRVRMYRISTGFRKAIGQGGETKISMKSLQARLTSPFWLPQGTSYPPMLTKYKQEKADAAAAATASSSSFSSSSCGYMILRLYLCV